MNAANPHVGGRAMKVTTKLLIVAAGAALLFALATAPSPAAAKSSSGAKVYKYKSDDLRLKLAVKGNRVRPLSMKVLVKCDSDLRGGWSSYSTKVSYKVKKNGRFGFKQEYSDGVWVEQLNARIHKRFIQGWFLYREDYQREAEGPFIHCWSGESMRKPKIKFRAHLVR